MSSPSSDLRRTPLYERHKAAGARLIDFGGWEMPVQYSGILDEHKTVRTAVGLFDVSHMGEVVFSGPRAQEAVQSLVTNDIGKLQDGGAQYNCVCYPTGGIVDDCIVYRHAADRFLIVVNASNVDKDVAWFQTNASAMCEINDDSAEWGLIAVQGPRAVELVQSIAITPVALLKPFTFGYAVVGGVEVTAARTGYTGEDGFELFVPVEKTVALWDALMTAGAAFGVKPIGLGARDTLRLEAKLSLYGNDIDAEHTPLEAGLGWVVKGRGYIGEAALAAQRAAGISQKLVGFVMTGRGIARHGYDILVDGNKVGVVTSGTTGPTVGKAVGMGYVPTALAKAGTKLTIDCRGKSADAEIVDGPFYRRSK